ncbi:MULTISPECIES: hypothetical protein [unclassified Pseudoxanthomonas]|uniref:hypothetical protein n=1 Tax=unclassified Pseudoxanthomonas TaxID=2645906 RepID=UPI00160F409B|nr:MULTISPECIES: hypothetical protein [unclassified Pseudoxanthomonas]MBB3274721.1 hypothetical protein [Pseudoxanthomonas sp. OG2]MBV7475448.1 hypothetical protein [Pseudoxanthomonas sp. PXM05]
MSKFKVSLLAIVSAAAMFGAASVSAATPTFQVWNGTSWGDGTTHFIGTTTASYFGNNLPCPSADFTVVVTSGVAKITAVSFGGSSACSNIIPRGLPWKVSITATSGTGGTLTIGDTASTTTNVNGVNVFIPAPLNANCPSLNGRAPVTGVAMTNSTTTTGIASIQFSGTLGACAVSSTAPTHLRNRSLDGTVSYPAARVVLLP